jgi:hypothetical protein
MVKIWSSGMTGWSSDVKIHKMRYIRCKDCAKIANETFYVGEPPLCDKHRAEATIEKLGGKVVWPKK